MNAITPLPKGLTPMPTLPHANGVYIDRDVLRLDHTFGPPVRRRRRRHAIWIRQVGPLTAFALWLWAVAWHFVLRRFTRP